MLQDTTKINIKSSKGNVGISLPELRFKKYWPKPNTIIKVDFSILRELVNDPGFYYMVEQGILFIDSKEAIKELGLEGLSGVDSFLTEGEIKGLVSLQINDFETKFDRLSFEQKNLIADYGMINGVGNFAVADYIYQVTGKNIINAYRLAQEMKQAEEAEKAKG